MIAGYTEMQKKSRTNKIAARFMEMKKAKRVEEVCVRNKQVTFKIEILNNFLKFFSLTGL